MQVTLKAAMLWLHVWEGGDCSIGLGLRGTHKRACGSPASPQRSHRFMRMLASSMSAMQPRMCTTAMMKMNRCTCNAFFPIQRRGTRPCSPGHNWPHVGSAKYQLMRCTAPNNLAWEGPKRSKYVVENEGHLVQGGLSNSRPLAGLVPAFRPPHLQSLINQCKDCSL